MFRLCIIPPVLGLRSAQVDCGGESDVLLGSLAFARPVPGGRNARCPEVGVSIATFEASAACYFAMRRFASCWAIEENTVLSSLAACTSKYMLGLVAQFLSSVAFPSITRIV